MKVQTIHWGEVEATYWRDAQGNEGLKPVRGDLPPSLTANDLPDPQAWPRLLHRGAAEWIKPPAAPAITQKATATDESVEDKAQAARDRMAKAREARRVNFKDGGKQ